MKIGNIPKEGEAIQLNKWCIGIEILRHNPHMFYNGFAFRPYIVIVCTKIIEYGNEHIEIDGKPAKKIGGWWRFEFPIGIHISVELI